jgi:cyclophilin family peptidyl-prolyl cis-trans isomerase
MTRTVLRRRPTVEVLEDRTLPAPLTTGTLTGTVFVDHNATGVLAPGDVIVPGVVVSLTGTTPNGSVSATATTDANGVYTFQNISSGTYQVSAGPLPFLVGTTPEVVGGISVGGGQTVTEDLGFGGMSAQAVSNIEFLASAGTPKLPTAPAGPGTTPVNSRTNSPPVVSTPIGTVAINADGPPSIIDLAGHFTDPDLANSQVTFNTNFGPLNVTLFDATAPQTVANFYDYINSGAYNNAIFTRLVSSFVLQAGGATLGSDASGSTLTAIPTLPPVPNEFSASNTTGTIAMAQSGNNANSATDQFFFNLTNNNASGVTNLDASKFTVFGQVSGPADQALLNALQFTPVHDESHTAAAAALPTVLLNSVPLNNYSGTNFPSDATASNFLVINSVTVDSRPEALTYSVVSNSNPGLISASLTNEQLTLTDLTGQAGSATITVRATDTFGASVDQTFTAVAVPLKMSSVTDPVNFANEATASASGTTGVGDTVTVTATDGTHTTGSVTATVNAAGAWTASGINVSGLSDGTIQYTATATDPSGNAVSVSQLANKKTAPSLSVTTFTNPVTIANETSTSISGTTDVGATVSVTATDGTHTTVATPASVDTTGAWSASGIDVSSLTDGPITYNVTATDAFGGTAKASEQANKDTVAITSATSPVTAANAKSVSVSGTTEVGATVSVTVTDGTTTTAAATATVTGGTWSVSNIDVSGLTDGTITYTAKATNGVGAPATANSTATKDTVTITSVTNPVNSTNVTSVGASGTTAVGNTVSVTVTDGTTTTAPVAATVDSSGNWTVSGINVTGLKDGTITYTATATDGSSNTATATRTASNTTAHVTVTTVTNPITLANFKSTSASGTTDVGDTVTVTASDGTNTTAPVTATVTGGTWTATGIDLSALNDGTITYTATAHNGIGPDGTATATSTMATVFVTLVTNPVTIANETSADASGTVNVGASVTVTVTDGTTTTTPVAATVDGAGNWTVSGINVTGLKDGTITYSATATDGGGNSRTVTVPATKSTVAITSVTNPVNSTNVTNVSASGTVQVGAAVSVTVTDGTTTTAPVAATVDGAGNWTVSGINVTGLKDGTITYTATATLGGNTATASKTATNSTAHVTISTGTNPITIANQSSVSLTGTTDVGATVTVVASDAASHVTPPHTATVDGSGNWTLTGFNVSGLTDGTITYTVTASTGSGPSASTSTTATKTTVAITSVTPNPVTASVASISGTTEVGAAVQVLVTDGTTNVGPLAPTVDAAGNWSLSNINLSTLANGNITFFATATLGGTAQAQVSVQKNG